MKKRGQFYLLAIIIILTVFIGFVTLTNSFRQEKNDQMNHFGEHIKIEKRNVLDYIANNNLDFVQAQEIFRNLSNEFILLKGKNKDLFFVFGNSSKVRIIGQRLSDTNFSVNSGNGFQEVLENPIDEEYPISSEISLKLYDNEYNFSMGQGQNIYYLARVPINNEIHIFQG